MSYTPLTSPITFTFSVGGYTPPSVPLSFQWEVGFPQNVGAPGLDAAAFGEPSLANLNRNLPLPGFDAAQFGATLVVPSVELFVIGFSAGAVGSPVAQYTQTFTAGTVGDTSATGAPSAFRIEPVLTFIRPATGTAPPLVFNFALGADVIGVYPSGLDAAAVGAASIDNAADDFRPAGFDAAAFASPLVYNQSQVVNAFGVVSLVFGDLQVRVEQRVFAGGFDAARFTEPTVYNLDAFIPVAGFTATQFGSTSVENFNKTLFVDGRDLGAVGQPTEVKTFLNFLSPAGIAPPAGQVPSVFVAFDIQYINPAPVPGPFFGAPQVTLKNQQLAPFPFTAFEPGTAFVSFKVREVRPTPAEFTVIPLHRVFDPTQRVFPAGMATQQVGAIGISNRNQTLRLPTIIATGITPPQVFNKNQFVFQPFTSFPTGGDVSPIDIRNRNRELYAEGIDSLRMRPFHEARLVAEAVAPEGFDAFSPGSTVVSNFIREMAVPGFDSYSGTRATVARAALDFRPSGFTATEFGVAYPQDGTLEVFVQTPAQTGYGTPRASLSPIVLTEVEAVNESAFGAARASVSPIVVTPPWTLSETIGGVQFTVRFNAIAPNSLPTTTFGEAAVSNRNRVLRMPSVVEARPPEPRIFNFVQRLDLQGVNVLTFGLHIVRDRTSRLFPLGAVPPQPSRFATLLKFPPDPPGSQSVAPAGITGLVGSPVLDDRGIRPPGFDTSRFGTARIQSNTILVTGIFEDFVGETRHLIPSVQVIDHRQTVPFDLHGKPQTQHLTIWASESPPAGAAENHPQSDLWHPPDYTLFPRPGVGTPTASNRVRFVAPNGIAPPEQAVHLVGNRRQFVFPGGLLSQRIGFPRIPNAEPPQVIGFDSAEVGQPSVAFYVEPNATQFARPLGFRETHGIAWVSNFIRELGAAGFVASRFEPGWPLVSLELPPVPALGFVATQFGTAYADYRVRSRAIDGFEATEFGPSLGDFRRRMRVFARTRAFAAGLADGAVGVPRASTRLQSARAEGFDAAWLFQPRIQATATTSGFDAATFGAVLVEAVEPGVIKGRGIPPGEAGATRVTMQVRPQATSGALGQPRVAMPIRLAGASMAQFGAAVAANDGGDHTCGMAARGVAVAGGSMTSFGVASVG